MGHFLAMKTGDVDEEIPGVDTVSQPWSPTRYGLLRKMSRPNFRDTRLLTCRVLATHITEILKNHAFEFIGRQEAQKLLDSHSQTEPKVVEELVPNVVTLGIVQKVLQNLWEQVSINDLHTILETLADVGNLTKDRSPHGTCEASASRQITRQYQTPDGLLPLITMNQNWKTRLQVRFRIPARGHTSD